MPEWGDKKISRGESTMDDAMSSQQQFPANTIFCHKELHIFLNWDSLHARLNSH